MWLAVALPSWLVRHKLRHLNEWGWGWMEKRLSTKSFQPSLTQMPAFYENLAKWFHLSQLRSCYL